MQIRCRLGGMDSQPWTTDMSKQRFIMDMCCICFQRKDVNCSIVIWISTPGMDSVIWQGRPHLDIHPEYHRQPLQTESATRHIPFFKWKCHVYKLFLPTSNFRHIFYEIWAKVLMQAPKILLDATYNRIAKGLYSAKLQRLNIQPRCHQTTNCIEHTISTTRCNSCLYVQSMGVYMMHNSFPMWLKVFENEGQVNMRSSKIAYG